MLAFGQPQTHAFVYTPLAAMIFLRQPRIGPACFRMPIRQFPQRRNITFGYRSPFAHIFPSRMQFESPAMPEPLLYETHSHTELCKHADGTIEQYAARAVERGFKGHTVTCHNPLPWGWSKSVRMAESQFQTYLDMVATARQFFQDRLDVRLGMEFDYAPELEQTLTRQIQWADFDYCLGSIHPQTDYYIERYRFDDPAKTQRTYFDLIARVADSGLFDCVSHPDLIKNYLLADWNISAAMTDIMPMLDRVAATNCAMELNTSGLKKRIPQMNPAPEMLAEMCKRNIPVVIGSDAHVPERVGADWESALDMLQAAGYTHINYFLRRKRMAVQISDARESLLLPCNCAE